MRFVRENWQMANKKLYREDVLQVLFADSDSEGEYLPFGNDDQSSNDCASPGTSLHAQWCRARKARVFTKHKQVIIWTLCPTGMGVAGVDVVVVSIQELLLADDRPDYVVCSDRARSNGRWQTVQVQSVWVGLCAVPCNERYHTLKNYKLSPRYLIGQIAGKLIKKNAHVFYYGTVI